MTRKAGLLLLCCLLLAGSVRADDDDDDKHWKRWKDQEHSYRKLNHKHREIVKRYHEELEDADDRDDYREAREEYLEDLRKLEKERRKELRKYGAPYDYGYSPHEGHYRYREPVYRDEYVYPHGSGYGFHDHGRYEPPRHQGTFRYQGKNFSIYVD